MSSYNFGGSSRRPRQVDLSGQPKNPFGASAIGWTQASGSGTQKTVAAAHQERQNRQQERDRLNASKKIQSLWRGHRVRRDLAEERRKVWDDVEAAGGSDSDLARILRLLVAFFDIKRPDDVDRLVRLSERVLALHSPSFLLRQDIQTRSNRLVKITLEALQKTLPKTPNTLIQFLLALLDACPTAFGDVFRLYYNYFMSVSSGHFAAGLDNDFLLPAFMMPLKQGPSSSRDTLLSAYSAFALEVLTSPNLSSVLTSSYLATMAKDLDFDVLSTIIVRTFSSGSADQLPPERRLWLLAHFIALSRFHSQLNKHAEFLKALSLQLSSSSDAIIGRLHVSSQSSIDDDDDSDKIEMPPIDPFVKEQLLMLVDQVSITGLLTRFKADTLNSSDAGDEDASFLSSYALTLLRIFPDRSDEIRMWLCQGSLTSPSGSQIPALKFFWQAMAHTNTFHAITSNSNAALSLLLPKPQSVVLLSSEVGADREWRTILLFLELYNFVLRFTDDEEFLSADSANFRSDPVTRFREIALPLADVKRLTVFLKNVAFTAYYNAGELLDDDTKVESSSIPGSSTIGTLFGAGGSSRFQDQHHTAVQVKRYRPFAGIAGMKFSYVRVIVTGVMRMLYERDSRRRFLPSGHWLMTSHFDMEGFIPAVVAEEERRHEYQGEEDEDDNAGDEEDSQEVSRLVGMERSRRAQHIEGLRKQQKKAAQARYMAQVGPRLEVLQNMPFAIPFETRVQIFRQFVLLDQLRRRGGNVDPDIWRMQMVQNAMANHVGPRPPGREILGRHHARIRRDQTFEDAFDAFYELGEGLKEPIQITFVDQFDTAEAGIDGGGVTKEFLTSITNDAFRPSGWPKLFVVNDQNLLYPNPATLDERRNLMRLAGLTESSLEWKDSIKHLLAQYQFLGRVVGKCLYEGILVDISFAGFFLLKWAFAGATSSESGYKPNINDLRDFDESLYQGLLKLKDYDGKVEDFSLDFTIQDTFSRPGEPDQTITRDLIPNGANVSVTNQNRPMYISYVARHRLLIQPYQQTQAFLRGLSEIIKPSWLSMFNQSELQTLIGGETSDVDVQDLRHNTIYGGVYQIGDDGLEHPTVQNFWKAMEEMNDSDRRKVLKYVTSTPRAPLLGFSQLNPRFSIRDAGSDEERLPSTSTCVNLLKLPIYKSAKILKDKLLYAVNSGAGFDLS